MAKNCEICKTPDEIAVRLDMGLKNPGREGCATSRYDKQQVYNVETEGALTCRIRDVSYNPEEIIVVDKSGLRGRTKRK